MYVNTVQYYESQSHTGEKENMSDSTFRDTDKKTASIAVESLSYRRQLETTSNLQLQQQSGNSLARDLDTGELASTGSGEERRRTMVRKDGEQPKDGDNGESASTGSGEESISLENLLALCPNVSSNPLDEPKDDPTAQVASTCSVPCAASGGPSLWEDADNGNTALSNASSKCSPGEIKLFWPLEVRNVKCGATNSSLPKPLFLPVCFSPQAVMISLQRSQFSSSLPWVFQNRLFMHHRGQES